MTESEIKVYNAIRDAVRDAIDVVGGVEGVRAMSMFPSAKKALAEEKKAA